MNDAPTWFKSSYSGDEGGDCLEVAYSRRKPTHTAEHDGAPVVDATRPTAVHVRDSKNPGGPMLSLAPAAWAAFTASLS